MEATVNILEKCSDIVLRRKWQALIASITLALVILFVIFMPEPVYRSTATLLLEEQPLQDLHETIGADIADPRLRLDLMSQSILSAENLQPIVDRFGLHADEGDSSNRDDILNMLRRSINTDIVSGQVSDPNNNQSARSDVTFTLSFDGGDAEMAQQVVSALASLYLNAHLKSGSEKATEMSEKSAGEIERIEQEIAAYEQKLVELSHQIASMAPEQLAENMAALGQTERELLDLDQKVGALTERRTALEAELAKAKSAASLSGAEENDMSSPVEKLRFLETKYVTAKAAYSARHPDVVKLEREIYALRAQLGPEYSRVLVSEQLAGRQQALANARKKYAATDPSVVRLEGEVRELEVAIAALDRLASKRESLGYARAKYESNHPYIRRLENEISALEQTLAALSANLVSLENTGIEDTEKALQVTLKAQLDTVSSALKAARSQKAALKVKKGDYEQRIAAARDIESAYAALKRDHENALAKLLQITAHLSGTQIEQQSPTDHIVQRFSLLVPPPLPEQPIEPNRLMVLILGFALAAGAALAAAALAQRRLRGQGRSRAFADILSHPPLDENPFVEAKDKTPEERASPLVLPEAAVASPDVHQGADWGGEVDAPERSTEAASKANVPESAPFSDSEPTMGSPVGDSEGGYRTEQEPSELMLDEPHSLWDEPAVWGESRLADTVVQMLPRSDKQRIRERDDEPGSGTTEDEQCMTFGQRLRSNHQGFYY